MKQRGRVSLAAIATGAPPIASNLPDPPSYMRPDERGVWTTTVETKPPGWFSPDCFPLLATLCRATITHRMLADLLADFKPSDLKNAATWKRYERLLNAQERQSRLIMLAATKLRLTPQSRYEIKGSAVAHRRAAGTANKPWEK